MCHVILHTTHVRCGFLNFHKDNSIFTDFSNGKYFFLVCVAFLYLAYLSPDMYVKGTRGGGVVDGEKLKVITQRGHATLTQ